MIPKLGSIPLMWSCQSLSVTGSRLTKDFPLTGHTEVRYSENQKKVIYEPVKLEQNYRDFDFETPWQGTKYIKDKDKDKD